jgi:hypothetical protein
MKEMFRIQENYYNAPFDVSNVNSSAMKLVNN